MRKVRAGEACKAAPPNLRVFEAATISAEIAQLVEHNLAKVGVAGPSPVFRSNVLIVKAQVFKPAQVAEW